MEKNNGKTIAVVSLVVAVFALAVGFATFSANLTIDSSATVVPGDQFSPYVKWKENSISCQKVAGNANAAATSVGSFDTDRVAWSGVTIKLIEPGDSVSCSATVENTSSFVAYLRSITTSAALSCAAGTTTDDISPATNASDVCPWLRLDIEAGTGTPATAFATSTAAAAGSFSGAQALSVPATNGEQNVKFTLTYRNDTGVVLANGTVAVTIPTITLNYKTDNTSA